VTRAWLFEIRIQLTRQVSKLGDSMNHRERFFTALDLKEPDFVPLTDLGLDPPIVQGILSKGVPRAAKTSGADLATMTATHSWQSSMRFRLDMIDACMRLDFDAVPVFSDYSLVTRSFAPKFIDSRRFIDQWGRLLEASEKGKTTYFVGGVVNTPEQLQNYEPPDPFDPGIVEMMGTILKSLKGKDIVTIGELHSGWHLAFQVRGGIDKIAIDSYRNPDFARGLIDKIGTACRKFADAMIEAGVDVLFVTDDYADNHGPYIERRLLEECELPNLKKIVELAHRHDVPVLKHSDGNLYPILDEIINTGIDGLHPIEPGPMDLADVKARYGTKLCLLGNVDCKYVLPYGNEEDTRKDVRRCIDSAAKGGGFILASSNSIHSNVKIANIYAMVDEARKYGKYPLS
jgi:uroporphyrinogen decarboxylase